MVEQEVAGHTASRVRKQSDKCLCLAIFSFLLNLEPPPKD